MLFELVSSPAPRRYLLTAIMRTAVEYDRCFVYAIIDIGFIVDMEASATSATLFYKLHLQIGRDALKLI